jgi:hypothetical protein
VLLLLLLLLLLLQVLKHLGGTQPWRSLPLPTTSRQALQQRLLPCGD